MLALAVAAWASAMPSASACTPQCDTFAVEELVLAARTIPLGGAIAVGLAHNGTGELSPFLERVEVVVHDAGGVEVDGAVTIEPVFGLLVWRPTAPFAAGASYRVEASLRREVLQELGSSASCDDLRLDETIEVAVDPAPAFDPSMLVSTSELAMVPYDDDLESLVCCDGSYPGFERVDGGHCGDTVGFDPGDGSCFATRSRGELEVEVGLDVAASSETVVANFVVRRTKTGIDLLPHAWRATLGGPQCLVTEVFDIARGEVFSDERCWGDDVADAFGEHAIDPSAEIATTCAGDAYVCQIALDGAYERWNPSACVTWPEGVPIAPPMEETGEIPLLPGNGGCGCRSTSSPSWAPSILVLAGLARRRRSRRRDHATAVERELATPRAAARSRVLALVMPCGCEAMVGPAHAELDELCGSSSPTRLLELDAGVVASPSDRGVIRHEGRWLIGLREPLRESSLGEPRGIVSVAACGGDVRTVARGADVIMSPPTAELSWFACGKPEWLGSSLHWIDPSASAPSRDLGATRCQLAWIDDEVVYAERLASGDERLVVARFDEVGNTIALEVLVERLATWHHRTPVAFSDSVGPEPTGHVYALTQDDELLDVDVPARTSLMLRSATHGLAADGDLLAFWSVGDWSPQPTVVDLATGMTKVDETPGDYDVGPVIGPGAITFKWTAGQENTLLIDRATMTKHYLNDSLLDARAQLSDGLVVLGGLAGGENGLYTWHTGQKSWPYVRLAGQARAVWHDEDLWAVVRPASSTDDSDAAFQLVRFADPTLEMEVLLDDVNVPLPLRDGRWLAVRTVGDDRIGSLLLLDEDAAEPLVVDDDVDRSFAQWQGGPDRTMAPELGGASVIYMIARGDRRGAWIAALAP